MKLLKPDGTGHMERIFNAYAGAGAGGVLGLEADAFERLARDLLSFGGLASPESHGAAPLAPREVLASVFAVSRQRAALEWGASETDARNERSNHARTILPLTTSFLSSPGQQHFARVDAPD